MGLSRQIYETEKGRPRTHYELAVTLNETIIGGCGIVIRNSKSLEAEIGYCLNEDYWRIGIGTEVAGALIDYGFNVLDLRRLYAKCDPDNIDSYRVMENNGMIYEGRQRETEMIRGEWYDRLLYSILRRNWEDITSGSDPVSV